ncbi:MAG: hypothetical protein K5657_06420 [Desulfovibrio sp.]|nr:hypothetical protein [Desulfovibrio sp.]
MLKASESSLQPLQDIPLPKSAAHVKKVGFLAFFAVCCVGLLAFWLTRPEEVREQLREDASGIREEAAQFVDDATRGTPLAGIGRFIRKEDPPTPESVLHPPTNSGTLAGPVIRGESGRAGMLLPDGTFRKDNQPVLARVEEDSWLKKRFVENLAAFIVGHYTPKSRGGAFSLSLSSLNQYCATRLNTEGSGGRSAFLRYAFHSSMLEGLYSLYAGYFAGELERKAREKWNDASVRSFFSLLSEDVRLTAMTLEAILQDASLMSSLQQYEKDAETCDALRAEHTVALFELEQMRERRADPAAVNAQKLRVDALAARLPKAFEQRDQTLRSALAPVKKALGSRVEEGDLLFLTLWVRRRLETGPAASSALKSVVSVLKDFSHGLARLASGEHGAFSNSETGKSEGGMERTSDGKRPIRHPSDPGEQGSDSDKRQGDGSQEAQEIPDGALNVDGRVNHPRPFEDEIPLDQFLQSTAPREDESKADHGNASLVRDSALESGRDPVNREHGSGTTVSPVVQPEDQLPGKKEGVPSSSVGTSSQNSYVPDGLPLPVQIPIMPRGER